MATREDKAHRFRALHEGPRAFVIANAWDGGSACVLAGLGLPGAGLGPKGCLYSLGATALEAFCVDADPVARRLTPLAAVIGGFLASR
jgi:2-methylisocitrate lyase-like PEP mutase family enzyme